MLRLMRKHARSWGMILLLGIIVIVFIFYFGYSSDQGRANTVATLDGNVISYRDYQQEYDALLDYYRNQLGRNFSEEMIKLLNLKEQAFDKLLGQAIILAKAKELNLQTEDEELKNSIMANPAFRRDGSFNQRVYEEILRQNKLTPENFETRQRQMLVTTKLQNLIAGGIRVSDEDVFALYLLQKEKINLSFLKLVSNSYLDSVKPSRQALEDFYKEHKKDFRVPEQLQTRYIVFSAAAEAKQAHDAIYQQENFTAFAADKGLKVLTSPFFPANNIPVEFRPLTDFSKNIFTLQVNEMSRVMSDEKGYYVFQVAAKKPSYVPDFTEAAGMVESRYAEKEAAALCEKDANQLLERLKKGEPWEKAAKGKNISSGETGLISPAAGLPELGFTPQADNPLTQLSQAKPYPDKVLPGNGSFVIVRFKERSKPDEADFQTSKDELKKTLKEIKTNETLKAWLGGYKLDLIKEGRLKITRDINGA
ncbi:MAG: peptidylprolyl isomerase [Syntrophales bacterium]